MRQLNNLLIRYSLTLIVVHFFGCSSTQIKTSLNGTEKIDEQESLFLKATEAYVDGAYQESEALLLKLLEKNKSKQAYVDMLSHVYMRSGQFDKAIISSKKSLHLNANQVEPYYVISFCHIMKDELSFALLAIERGLSKFPDNPHLLLNQGLIALKQNNFQYANQLYNKILKLKKDWSPALHGLSLVYMFQEDYKAALELLNRISLEGSNTIEVLLNMGVCLRELKQYKDAENKFLEVLKFNPNHPKAIFNLGLLNSDHLDNLKSSLDYFDLFKKLKGNSIKETDSVHQYIADVKERLEYQRVGSKK